MILTVSPNVALDRVRVIRAFRPGQQSRALSEFLQPGGSGVHATAVIQALGGASVALGALGGHLGELWKVEADRRGLVYDMLSIPDETRESFCLIDLDQGSVVESVQEGPRVALGMKSALLARLEARLPAAELLILSGSLPPGLPLDIYADMIELARRYAVPTLADIHSEPLRHAVPFKPWLVKPNLAEFKELTGLSTDSLAKRARAGLDFCQRTGVVLALSMAEAGLLLSTPDRQWLLTPPPLQMHLPDGLGKNVIGCGDALVGALAFEYCRSQDLLSAAKLGMAAAHFNLSTFGVPEIDPEQVMHLAGLVQVQDL